MKKHPFYQYFLRFKQKHARVMEAFYVAYDVCEDYVAWKYLMFPQTVQRHEGAYPAVKKFYPWQRFRKVIKLVEQQVSGWETMEMSELAVELKGVVMKAILQQLA
jgi:hypothetical protein